MSLRLTPAGSAGQAGRSDRPRHQPCSGQIRSVIGLSPSSSLLPSCEHLFLRLLLDARHELGRVDKAQRNEQPD
jgi:hypothetical protein